MGRRRGERGSVAVVETTSTAPFVPEGARYLSLSGLRGERGQDSGINNLSGAERGGSRDRLDVSERRTARVILSRPLPPIHVPFSRGEPIGCLPVPAFCQRRKSRPRIGCKKRGERETSVL